MKTVFSNSQTAHVWAQQSQDTGRSSHGNITFDGPTIYSYGSHFPLATFIDADTVLVNSDSYSVSTSKHQNYVAGAIRHKKRIHASTAVIKAFIWDRTFNDQAQRAALRECNIEVERYIQRAKAKKAERYKANDINAARSAVNKCKELFTAFGARFPDDLLKLESMVSTDDFKAIIQADDSRRAELENIAEEKRAARQKTVKLDIEKNWIKGRALESGYSAHECEKIYMRIEGDKITTTRGAEFPLAHAKSAFKIIRTIKEKKQIWKRNGKTIHLGHFQIDEIDAAGNVKAGCHTVEWNEIERIARKLKIFP